MPQWLSDLWHYLTTDPLGIAIFTALVLALLQKLTGIPVRLWRALLRRIRSRPSSLDDESRLFEVVKDPAALLPKLYNEGDNPAPLADHRIGYQPRVPNRNITEELRAALKPRRYLLNAAPTGFGKTREAATLAQTMMINEGYRVVLVKHVWLDKPKALPAALYGDQRRIIILLDDLNGLFSQNKGMEPPNADGQAAAAGVPSCRDRLRELLDKFVEMCGEHEIRVIATARDEAAQWAQLAYDERDALWGRFAPVVRLPLPSEASQMALLESESERASVPTDRDDIPAMASANEGAFANLVLNLRRVQREGKSLSRDTFKPTLGGSWREDYERALRQHPAVRAIYDAMDVLRQAGIDLYPFVVEPTAARLWGGAWWQRWRRRRAIGAALRYLGDEKVMAQSEGRLAPKDGQIEAKGTTLDWRLHAEFLQKLLLRLADRRRDPLLGSLLGFGVTLYNAKQFEQAAALWKKGTALAPQNAVFANNLGVALANLNRPAEADAAYRKAIELNPQYATAYNNLGNLLRRTNRPEQAEETYRKGLLVDPDNTDILNNLVFLLRLQQRERDVVPLLEKWAALAPQDFNPPLALASIHKHLGDAAASAKYAAEARPLIPADDGYNLACLESICGNVDLALEQLRRAAQQPNFDREWARQDPDLEWIRNDPRFGEIVGKEEPPSPYPVPRGDAAPTSRSDVAQG